jgi:hypothetical protein
MDGIITKLRLNRMGKEPRRITAVAAYEDSVTDSRVNEFCRALARQLGCQCEVVRQMWLLNELRVPQLRTVAAGEAASADLLIVSLHHSQELPDEVKSWIESSLAHKSKRPAVLLAFVDPEHEGDSSAMRTFLEQAAAKAKLEFVTQAVEAPEYGLA